MRLVDADKIYPDCMTKDGKLAISQSQLANAPIVKINTNDIEYKAYCKGVEDGKKIARPQGEWIMQRHDLDGCFYTCSNCGRMIRVSLFIDDPEDNETLADYPFCHCGADMRKGNAE